MRCELVGLDCPVCAQEIEDALVREPGLEVARVNFSTATLIVPEDKIRDALAIIGRVEPGVRVRCPDHGSEHRDEAQEPKVNPEHVRVVLALAAFIAGWIPRILDALPTHLGSVFFLISFAIAGYPVIITAARNLVARRPFDENVLMTVATGGAVALGEYPEAAAVMVFFSIGEALQATAVRRSRAAVTSLMELRPDTARISDESGERTIPIEEVEPGNVIVVHPGERVPLDGIVVSGETTLDTSALTGESAPRPTAVDDSIHAGSVNGGGVIRVQVTRPHYDSAVARILDMVTEAAEHRAPVERFLTRFARWYTPAVVLGAIALAIIPPLAIPGETFSTWVYRSLILLVISCPCALVVSIPLGYFAGIGLASRNGILVKGADVLDTMTSIKTVIMDKTGTLTDGRLQVSEVDVFNGFSADNVLSLAARAERRSNHPVADAILRRAPALHPGEEGSVEEIPGRGMRLNSSDGRISVGNRRLMTSEGISTESSGSTEVFVGVDGVLAGRISFTENPRKKASDTLAALRKLGIERLVLLTGDSRSPAEKLARALQIGEIHSELLPEDKVRHLESLREEADGPVMFIGDGINDAPVLMAADVGVALGGLGSDAAIEASDLVIMEDRLESIPTALEIAQMTRRRVIQNTVGALSLKALFLTLGALGMTGIWAAVFADVGVTLLAVINSASLLRAEIRH